MSEKHYIRKIGICALCLVLFPGFVFADGESGGVALAIFPCTDVVASFKKFSPLISYLKETTGMDVTLKVPMDFETLKRDLDSGDTRFVLQDPNIYVKLAPKYDRDYLLGTLALDGTTSQSGVVIVRKDSGIDNLQALKGKTVMFGPKMSAAKWVAAKLLFEENGFDIDSDLTSYTNGTCCEDIAFSIFLKAMDAGVVCDHFLGEHAKKQQELGVNAEELRIIGQTRAVPTKVFAPLMGTDRGTIAKINKALLKLSPSDSDQSRILYSAEIGGFQSTEDGNYESFKTLFGVTADP